MNFHTRKWIKPEDLNPNGTLFGGSLLKWIDEEAAIYSIIQLENNKVVTKQIDGITFHAAAKLNDIVELGIEVVNFGKSALTLKVEARNKLTRATLITIDSMVFVNVDEAFRPKAHGKDKVEYVRDRLANKK